MKIFRSIAVAFSLYSKIPMPMFEWNEEDLRHQLIFLPWVGAVIAAVIYGISMLFDGTSLPLIFAMAIYSLIPLVITGGFHMDGFLDVEDAMHSYRSKEEKLEILKDPHIGAFAVIRLLMYVLLWGAGISLVVVSYKEYIYLYALIFVLSRANCGVVCQLFRHAKQDGMLHMETKHMRNADVYALMFEAVLCVIAMISIHLLAGMACVAGIAVFNLYFHRLCYKEFGGITGDTAGYYVVVSELWMLWILAAFGYWGI